MPEFPLQRSIQIYASPSRFVLISHFRLSCDALTFGNMLTGYRFKGLITVVHGQFSSAFVLFLVVQNVITGVVAVSGDCIKDSACSCHDPTSGVKIDLSGIVKNLPENKPLIKDVPKGVYQYSYLPCRAFSEPNSTTGCQQVAACQKSRTSANYFNIGTQDSAQFKGKPGTSDFSIQYNSTGPTTRVTVVHLKCSNDFGVVDVMGETSISHYEFTLSTKYACVPSGLSPGSIMLIILVVLIVVYLVGGFLIMRFGRGARGLEQIPNLEFWTELPSLIRDGSAFVFSGCKRDQTYQEI